MTNRRVVMMALAASLGFGLSASAQSPNQSSLVTLLKRSAQPTVVAPSTPPAPVSATNAGSPTIPFQFQFFLQPTATPPTNCGPRPPRPI